MLSPTVAPRLRAQSSFIHKWSSLTLLNRISPNLVKKWYTGHGRNR